MSVKKIDLVLSNAEGLVLYEWLCQMEDEKKGAVMGEAELKVLWKIEGQLEKVLVEPLEPGYKQKVEIARKKVIDSEG
jgi:hypothetical protein